MPNYQSLYTGAEHDMYVTKAALIDLIYPVGAIYISYTNINPSDLFGGTWEQVKDKFILAAGDSYDGGTTGGNAEHTHTTPATTTGSHTLTVNEMPSHNHRGIFLLDGNSDFPMGAWPGWAGGTNAYPSLRTDTVGRNGCYDIQPPSNGGGQGHTHSQVATTTSSTSNLPPYLVVYMWRTTA